MKTRGHLFILLTFIITTILLVLVAYHATNTWSRASFLGFILLAYFIYAQRITLHISIYAYAILLLGILAHLAGTMFGFYAISPVPFAWDIVSHAVAFVGIAWLFFNYIESILGDEISSKGRWMIVVLILLASTGVGVFVEIAEFSGYAFFGMQNGALLFGGGDFDCVFDETVASEIALRGGGWHDSMQDLVVNLLASVATLIGLLIHKKVSS